MLPFSSSCYRFVGVFRHRVRVQLVANAVVGVVVEDSVLQLWLFCATNTLGFLLLAVLKPFANGLVKVFVCQDGHHSFRCRWNRV